MHEKADQRRLLVHQESVNRGHELKPNINLPFVSSHQKDDLQAEIRKDISRYFWLTHRYVAVFRQHHYQINGQKIVNFLRLTVLDKDFYLILVAYKQYGYIRFDDGFYLSYPHLIRKLIPLG